MTRILVLLSALVCGDLAPAAGRSTAGSSAIVLKIEAFKSGFRNCSRETPEGTTGFWQVRQSDADKTDVALMLHLERTGLAKTLRGAPVSYGRQYLGYNRGKRRFIYVNAFARAPGDLRSVYVRGCDGGNLFWGIEYDVQSESFGRLEINGAMGDPLQGLKP
jgi:hypothetical protein